MSRKYFALVAVISLIAATPADARDWFTNGWHCFWTDWHRNNCWPEPFIYPDRASVWAPYTTEIAKGWQRQNLLGEHHFEPDGLKLSPAGVNKLHWILTQNPPEFRTVFVERSFSDDTTAKRLDAAQQAAVDYTRGALPDVVVSDMRTMGTPAEYINAVNSKFMADIPDPKLPPPMSIDTGSSN